MLRNIRDKMMSHKKLCLISFAGLAALVVLLVVIIRICVGRPWTVGGEDTKGPFRYRLRSSDTLELRVDTENLPEGELVVKTPDSSELQTQDLGMKGKEHVYRLTGTSTYASWELGIDAGSDGESGALYTLHLSLSQDEKGKLTVSFADAADSEPVHTISFDSYTVTYQRQTDGSLFIRIEQLYEYLWHTEHDEKLINVGDIFYDGTNASCTVNGVGEEAFETELSMYTLWNDAVENSEHDLEFCLKLKGENGQITEVTHE